MVEGRKKIFSIDLGRLNCDRRDRNLRNIEKNSYPGQYEITQSILKC